jgi:hypothetical protein
MAGVNSPQDSDTICSVLEWNEVQAKTGCGAIVRLPRRHRELTLCPLLSILFISRSFVERRLRDSRFGEGIITLENLRDSVV